MGEYEELIARLAEQVIDPHAAITGRLDFIGPKIVAIEKEISMPGVKIEQIPFAYNLAALQGVTLTELAPFNGYIRRVTIHWPDGCDALVDVKVGRGTEQFCPREGFLALNDATPTYPFNVEVEQGNEIWVEMRNTDGANPHNITVTVSLEEKT